MGLDWNPMNRPRPGHEAEFETLVAELTSGRTPRKPGFFARWLGPRRLSASEEEARLARFQEISEAPFVALGAPRVGFDAAADAWLRSMLEAKGQLAGFEEARREMHGYSVLDLLPPCDGFPLYTNFGAYAGLDRYSFRGQLLEGVKHILGTGLVRRAYDRMLARELAQYAAALEEKALPWAASAGVAQVAQSREAPAAAEGEPASQAHIVFSAVRWCRYWAERGHGLEPWS